MADERMEDIVERLAALEARQTGERPDRGHGPPAPPVDDDGPPGPPGLGAGFDEKRVVDLIVGLVVEQVDRILERRLAELEIDEEHLAKRVAQEVDRQLGENVERWTERFGLEGKKKKKKRKRKRD